MWLVILGGLAASGWACWAIERLGNGALRDRCAELAGDNAQLEGNLTVLQALLAAARLDREKLRVLLREYEKQTEGV